MEQNVFDVLKERGFIEQTTHEAENLVQKLTMIWWTVW